MRTHEEPPPPPTRDEINATTGPLLVEFGASWCGHCRALAPHLKRLLDKFPDIPHLKVEDGPGQPLGRSFGVKLWPTLVFLRDGEILKQIARPSPAEAHDALREIQSPRA